MVVHYRGLYTMVSKHRFLVGLLTTIISLIISMSVTSHQPAVLHNMAVRPICAMWRGLLGPVVYTSTRNTERELKVTIV